MFNDDNKCTIIPPFIEDNIEREGNDEQKAKIRAGRAETERFRLERRADANIPRSDQVKDRLIYDADRGYLLPGQYLRRTEGAGPTGDDQVDLAYLYSGATYDLFFEEYSRNSLDGLGMDLISSVRFRPGYDNAFWNGVQMVYGEGDMDLPEASACSTISSSTTFADTSLRTELSSLGQNSLIRT